MLPLAAATVIAFMTGALDASANELQTRLRRQNSYTVYYLCGKYPNQYISYYPCPCTNCGQNCRHRCSNDMFCQTMNINWRCRQGCCKESSNYPPVTTSTTTRRPTTAPNPLCDGREASAGYCRSNVGCPSGFTCTPNQVCCRCSYGTSIGPCVNLRCPDNFQCNSNNECCPYQVDG